MKTRKVPYFKLLTILLIMLPALALAGIIGMQMSYDEIPKCARNELSKLAGDCPAWLVFQGIPNAGTNSVICLGRVGSPFTVNLQTGRYPRWSPDGERIAFFFSTNVCVMSAWGDELTVLASTRDPKPRALMFHPNGREVWYVDEDRLHAVNIDTRQNRTMTIANLRARSLDISADGRRMMAGVFDHEIYAVDVTGEGIPGNSRRVDRGCSACIMPSGGSYTDLNNRHTGFDFCRWDDDARYECYKHPNGGPVDNEAWSNVDRWLVFQTHVPLAPDAWVYDYERKHAIQITYAGDVHRPDLFVESHPTRFPWVAWWLRRLQHHPHANG
ncbi:MAG TPA: hypothetical protein DCS43_03045 [Verrucomicrobia bacterium]|nr:hypothetical protein [Verrucomicrobiota bacterium]